MNINSPCPSEDPDLADSTFHANSYNKIYQLQVRVLTISKSLYGGKAIELFRML